MTDNSPKLFLLFLLPMVAVGFWIACVVSTFDMLHAAVGTTALVIVATPFLLQSRTDWFSPWAFVVLSVSIGCAARGICISFMWPDPYEIDYYFLLGEEPGFFVAPYCFLLLGLSCLTLGYYSFALPKNRSVPLVENLRWNTPRLSLVLTIAAIVAVLATIRYIQLTGNFNAGAISAKRTVIFDIDLQRDGSFDQYGYLRQTAKLANFAYLVFLGHTLFCARRITMLHNVVAVVLLIVACVLPFYSSSRLPVMWTFLGTGALVWYSGRGVRGGHLIATGSLGIALFIAMTLIRGKEDVSDYLDRTSLAAAIIDGAVIHRNFLGLSKTAHVVNSVPKDLPYEYGKTIGVWAVSPIPRRLWSSKPLVHSGPVIGREVYGNDVSGVPPGMIAELYWNFHLFGIIGGAYVVGLALRWLGESFRPRTRQDLPLALIYVVGPMRLGFEIAGNSVGFGLMKVVVDSLSMALVLLLVLDYQKVVPSRCVVPRTSLRRAA